MKPPIDEPKLPLSCELPVRLKCALADCITLYSKIESCIVEVVWLLEGADLKRKREIARAWGKENLKVMRREVEALPGVEADKIWPTLNALREERNLIGHGVWMVAADGRPVVLWHARFLESDDWIGAEFFDWRRFDFFVERGEVLLQTVVDFRSLLQGDIEKIRARLDKAEGASQLQAKQ